MESLAMPSLEKVLVVDGDDLVRNFLSEMLNKKKFHVMTASNGEKALSLIKEQSFDLIFTEMKLLDMTGLDLLPKIKENSPHTLVIVITSYASVENAVEAMSLGAFSYLLKPFSPDAIEALLEKATKQCSKENVWNRETPTDAPTIIGESSALKKIIQEIMQVAPSHASVFISGESGTGKEVIAQAIHYHSTRAKKPFIKVNCAAVPETLIESEFFGHEKGSFTGANAKHLGRFELANQGSLLLDEITEIPIMMQAKLLRALQEQEFERIGGTKPVKVDVRMISTSNRDVKEAITKKMLREDLYYRLNVVPIYLPPLRERREDILPLTHYFLEKFCKQNHKVNYGFLTAEAEKRLLNYSWPGNVRELANIMERVVVMDQQQKITPEHLFGHTP